MKDLILNSLWPLLFWSKKHRVKVVVVWLHHGDFGRALDETPEHTPNVYQTDRNGVQLGHIFLPLVRDEIIGLGVNLPPVKHPVNHGNLRPRGVESLVMQALPSVQKRSQRLLQRALLLLQRALLLLRRGLLLLRRFVHGRV